MNLWTEVQARARQADQPLTPEDIRQITNMREAGGLARLFDAIWRAANPTLRWKDAPSSELRCELTILVGLIARADGVPKTVKALLKIADALEQRAD